MSRATPGSETEGREEKRVCGTCGVEEGELVECCAGPDLRDDVAADVVCPVC